MTETYLLTRNDPRISFEKLANQNQNRRCTLWSKRSILSSVKLDWRLCSCSSSLLLMHSCVCICTVSILSQDIIHLVIISVYINVEICIRICYYLRRNVHEDLPSSLFIQKLVIFEVEPTFYAFLSDKGQILLQTQELWNS